MIDRPAEGEFAEFYRGYIESVPGEDIIAVLEGQISELERLPSLVGASREQYRYAPEKWSIRELIGHLIDAERVFGYRAYCISRGDQAALPGFDEGEYVAHAGTDERTLASLIEELTTARRSNLHVFLNLPPGSETSVGNANGTPVSVRALAYMTAGHMRHHLGVLEERYGIEMENEK